MVTSCNPLKIYLYKEGLARFATSEFQLDKFDNTFIHLTNYAINKNSEKYKEADQTNKGTKRSIQSVMNVKNLC